MSLVHLLTLCAAALHRTKHAPACLIVAQASDPRPRAAPVNPRLQINYQQVGAQVVMEGTGVNLTREALQPYFDADISKVVVSAPVKDAEDPVLNIVVGCNEVRTRSYMTQ